MFFFAIFFFLFVLPFATAHQKLSAATEKRRHFEYNFRAFRIFVENFLFSSYYAF
jgi:hypothetical protein